MAPAILNGCLTLESFVIIPIILSSCHYCINKIIMITAIKVKIYSVEHLSITITIIITTVLVILKPFITSISTISISNLNATTPDQEVYFMI